MEGIGLSDLGSAGPVLLVLLVLSLASVAIIVTRVLALRGIGAASEERDRLLSALESGDLRAAPAAGAAPADRVASRAAELLGLGVSPALVESDLTGLGNAEVTQMSRGLRLLDLVGMIAPLLGLLGTVLGMIQSFRSLELAAGSANASILAGGIWQALLTTAAGLIVAIPALVGASYLASRVTKGTVEIERVIQRAVIAAARAAEKRSG
jgi:biopolymer transport protein ExbB